jgi:tetraacyldisaccharide 4'-kinase
MPWDGDFPLMTRFARRELPDGTQAMVAEAIHAEPADENDTMPRPLECHVQDLSHIPMSAETAYLEIVSGHRGGVAAGAARLGLRMCEPFYGAAIVTRNALFDAGLKRSVPVSVPVISVGNVTTGGTGKTPVVAAVVKALQALGVRTGIASRGYGRLDAVGNDELRVLGLLCPGAPHRQDRDRVAAAKALVEADRCNAIVLDDGFQHRRLARDLDIVLIDATQPWGYGHLLPRGLLREPVSALKRAGIVVITRADSVQASEVESIRKRVSHETSAPIVVSRFAATGVVDSAGQKGAVAELRGQRTVAFCGIGNPGAFATTVRSLGVMLDEEPIAFADHHAYTDIDLERIRIAAGQSAAQTVLCTLKDLVKIPVEKAATLGIRAVEIELEVLEGAKQWEAAMRAATVASI